MKVQLLKLSIVLLFLQYTLAQEQIDYCVDGTLTTSLNTCNKLTNTTHYCCMYTLISDDTSNLCHSVRVSTFNGTYTTTYNKNAYTVNCNVGNNEYATTTINSVSTCGQLNPTTKVDCNSQSTLTNSCCFYQTRASTGCYWLNSKYEGQAKWNNMVLECGSGYLTMFSSIFSIVIAVLLF